MRVVKVVFSVTVLTILPSVRVYLTKTLTLVETRVRGPIPVVLIVTLCVLLVLLVHTQVVVATAGAKCGEIVEWGGRTGR